MLPFIHLFGRQIPMYSLWSFLGCAVAFLYGYFVNRSQKRGTVPPSDLFHIGILSVVGVFVGAKLLYLLTAIPLIIEIWPRILENPAILISFITGGLVFYGGLIGGLAAAFWYCRRYSISFKTVVGILTPCIPLFHVFGRIGCFFAGCCWGIEVPWGFSFSHSIGAPNGVPLLPMQLIEAGGNLLLFIALVLAVRKMQQAWMALPLYLFLYGLMRFILEFFRGDKERGVALLSTSQWIALAIMLAVLLFFFRHQKKQEPHPPAGQNHP